MKKMMKGLFILLMIMFFSVSSCVPDIQKYDSAAAYSSYLDIPGITKDEINAIEALKSEYDSFVYGMPLSVEAFANESGEIRGFAALVCEWLTHLFDIPFRLELFSWSDLFKGMETGDISFTSEITITEERIKVYHMTSAIVSRAISSFRLAGARPIAEIAEERILRYGFIVGTVTIDVVTAELADGTYELVILDDFALVYDALRSGQIDSFFYSGVAEASFIEYEDIVVTNFFPLIRIPASLSTGNSKLEPIISVIDKALNENASRYLLELYNRGYKEYTRYKLFTRFTDEEIDFLQKKPVIPFTAEFDNYPTSFYDTRSEEWLGISFDMLKEIEILTGLKFEIANDQKTEFSKLIEMVEAGESSMQLELIRSVGREGRFIWPATSFKTDYPALISKMEHRFINIHEIYSVSVGVSRNTAYAELLHRWFPNHNHIIEYDSQSESFDAMMLGEVDMVMNSYSGLLYLTHYLERTGYKINFLFDYLLDSTFAFNKNQILLCSIVDKTLNVINTKNITDQWMGRIYDYRTKLAEAQVPWLIGSSILFLGILILVSVFLVRSRIAGRQLEEIVQERTFEIALQKQKMTSNYEYAKKLGDALASITKSPTISIGNLNAAADVIAREGCDALRTDRIGIWSFGKNANVLESIAYYDSYTGENTIQSNYDLTDRPEYLKLLQSERLIVMGNIDECKLISTAINDGNYAFLCAALDAPIRVDGKLVGVVCVEQSPSEEYFDKREWKIEEQNFASSLADLMALAISGSERRKARENAEMANQTKSSFLANMSHEIRTPMNAILGVTEILIQYESLPEEIEEGLSKIYSSCDLLLGIINDILDFSKIEAGKLDIMPVQYKVASMINDAVNLNMMRIDSKPIEFELNIDENVPAKLVGDELRIKQILNNLLSNAFKYTEAGKVTLSVSSEPIPLISYLPEHTMSGQLRWLNPDKEGTTLVLSVRDTGLGMTKEQLSRMFDEYSRFYRGKKVSVEGTGLGLAITQRLVTLMDGEIHVESEHGVGSLFIIRLPQEKVDDEVLGKDIKANLQQFRLSYLLHRKRGQVVRDPMPYGSVLIVDDVETNLYVAVGLLKLYKLQIDTAMSGIQAIEKIKQGKMYDTIFMDHMMPEMDGIETTKNLRAMNYTAPIVALTANAVAGQADMFLANGFDDFISKPIDIRQLNAVLNRLVRDKQPPEVIEAARHYKEKVVSVENKSNQNDLFLLESFVRDAHKAVDILDEQVLNKKYDDPKNGAEEIRKFTIIVHGIKSSLWNIGEKVLSESALKLEKCGRENNVEIIKETAPAFLKELHSLLEKLEEKINEKYNEDNADEDGEIITNKLKKIKERSADYNRKGVLEIINEITKCSAETRKVLENIKEYIIHSEFENAENAAEEYITTLQTANLSPSERMSSSLLAKKIDGLDIAKGLLRYEGDAKVYLRLLRSYAASVNSLLDAIGEINEETLGNYKIRVHGIKGTSLDVYADPVGNEAKNLEDAAKSGDLKYIEENNPAFVKAARKLAGDIENLIAAIEDENPKPKKDKPDDDMLKKLYDACKDFDIDEADKAISEIEKYKYEADDGLSEWLRDNMDKMNLKQIAEKLEDLSGKGE